MVVVLLIRGKPTFFITALGRRFGTLNVLLLVRPLSRLRRDGDGGGRGGRLLYRASKILVLVMQSMTARWRIVL